MLVIGHRGCSYKGFNQNTIKSFEQAVNDGVKALEFDVQKTSDDKLVIVHDLNLSNVSNGEGEVKKASSSQIKKLYAKTTAPQNEDKIPFLEDMFDFKAKSKKDFKLHLELKGENTAKLTCSLMKKYLNSGKLKADDFLVSSFLFNELQTVKNTLPQLSLAYLCGAVNRDDFITKTSLHEVSILKQLFRYHMESFMLPLHVDIKKYEDIIPDNQKALEYLKNNLRGDFYNGDIIQKAKSINALSINTWHKNLTKNFVQKAHKNGFKIFTFTVNEPDDIQRVLSFGVDGFFTDFYKEGFNQVNIYKNKL